MLTFHNCVLAAASHRELVSNFNRMTGCNFGKSLTRTPIEHMVDDACGASGETDTDAIAFIAFVDEFIWQRLPRGVVE